MRIRMFLSARGIYRDDPVFLEKLKNVQLAWIKLRDTDLALEFPHMDQPGYYGNIFPLCAADYKTELTLQHVFFLKRWLTGIEEGNICGGSRMHESSLKEIMNDAPISK